MSTITVGQENDADIEIYYEDHGSGHPRLSAERAFVPEEVNRALLEFVGAAVPAEPAGGTR